MKRLLPYPSCSAALFALWLVLNQTLAPAHLILGVVLAVAGGRVLASLGVPARGQRRRGAAALQLAWLVLADIVRSNIAVAAIVLNPARRHRVAGFLTVPLELRHAGGLAALACIVTATPGTSWARYDAGRSLLTIHVLDLVDEQAWVALFKARYERHLREIFE